MLCMEVAETRQSLLTEVEMPWGKSLSSSLCVDEVILYWWTRGHLCVMEESKSEVVLKSHMVKKD